MSKARRGGLGRGLGALIPTGPTGTRNGSDSDPVSQVLLRSPQIDSVSSAVVLAPTRDGAGEMNGGAPEEPNVEHPAPDGSGHPEEEAGPLPVPGAAFAEIDVAMIQANAKQPRQAFDEETLAELTHSIREFGVLQPIVVRERQGGYELVMGERRLRAAIAAGLNTIPAIIRATSDDAMLRDALLENIHRTSLNPLEEAAAYQQLLEEFGTTHEELAAKLGRSRSHLTNTIRLMNLPVPVQRRVAAGVISAGHARALLSLTDRELQEELAARIVAEGLSVRAVEELVALASRDDSQPSRRSRSTAPRISAPAINELADRLSDVFDTRVRVDLGKKKGRITVEFASVDDLERIVALIAPGLDGA